MGELNEDYIAKMEDVLELYERPDVPEEPVVCLNEKPGTLHADVRPASPAKPGREARQDNEYKCRGTADIFAAVEAKAGRHFTFATPDRSGFEFAKVAFELALSYPAATTIHLIMDNLNIHRRKSLSDLLGHEIGSEVWDRFTVHYTPTHGSWLNQTEIEIGMFSRQCLGSRRVPDLATLHRETRAWSRRINRARTGINWQFDRRVARRKFGYQRSFSRGHGPGLIAILLAPQLASAETILMPKLPMPSGPFAIGHDSYDWTDLRRTDELAAGRQKKVSGFQAALVHLFWLCPFCNRRLLQKTSGPW